MSYLTPITIHDSSGEINIHCSDSCPLNPKNNSVWHQANGSPNSIWVWNSTLNQWISAHSFSHSESLELVPTTPALTGLIQLLPVRQSISGYGLLLCEAMFTGQVSVNNDINSNWSFQLSCGSNVGLPMTTAGLQANSNDVVGRSLNTVLLPTMGKLVECSIFQTGFPGSLTGIFSVNYRLVYVN